jgi:hypothetical protein
MKLFCKTIRQGLPPVKLPFPVAIFRLSNIIFIETIPQLEPGWKLTEMICEDTISFNELKKAGKEQ